MDWRPQASSKLSRENKNIATKTYLLYPIAAEEGKGRWLLQDFDYFKRHT